MIKIVHLITGLATGGAETMLYKLLSRTDRSRFAPTVISLSGRGVLGDRIGTLGVPVIDIGMHRGKPSLAGFRRLLGALRGLEPDILQGWMYHGNLAAQAAAFFLRKDIPVVWNVRQSLYSLSHEKRMTALAIRAGALLSRHPEAIIYNSRVSAQQHEAAGFRAKKAIFIPNGFDTDLFAPSPEAKRSVRAELGVPEDALLVGLVGRYHPMKDHAGFLRAAAAVLGRAPGVRCVVIGADADGNNGALCAAADSLGIRERVLFLGERSDIPRLTAGLDIAVSSSAYGEGFPNVIGEAMACGVPCVVTDVGDSASVVGDTGAVVPPGNPAALAHAILALVQRGADERRERGERARRRVRDHYALDAVVARYQDLYQGILSGDRLPAAAFEGSAHG